jgi:transcriptional regulator with XRE-family HTH domain
LPEKFPEKTLDYGSAVRRLRQERGMTSEALAGAAEVSPSYLSEVERGLKRPSTDVLAKLAGAFGMLPSQLLEHVEMLTAGPQVVAQAFEPPRVRQERAGKRGITYSSTDSALPRDKDRLVQLLLTTAQDLTGEDLRMLLDLARHLVKRGR